MDRLYGLILDQSRPPRPIVGPLGTLLLTHAAKTPEVLVRGRTIKKTNIYRGMETAK